MNRVEPIRDAEIIHAMEERLAALDTPRGCRMYLMFECGIYLGLRISDLRQIKVKDVRGRDVFIAREQKTGKLTQLPISDRLKRVFRDRLRGLDGEDYILPSRQGREGDRRPAINRKTAYNDIQDIGRAAGVDFAIGCHTLRKTFGYHYYRQTGDIAFLMIWYNHSSAEVTKRYIGIDLDERAKKIKRFVI